MSVAFHQNKKGNNIYLFILFFFNISIFVVTMDALLEIYDLDDVEILSDIDASLIWYELSVELDLLNEKSEIRTEKLENLNVTNREKIVKLFKLVTERNCSNAFFEQSKNGNFECEKCGVLVNTVGAKERHERFNLCSKQCATCQKRYTNTIELIRHLSTSLCSSKGLGSLNSIDTEA